MSRPESLAPAHRARVLELLADEHAVAVLPSAPLRQYSHDVDYTPFRPDSDFHYVTEFPEPDAVAVLAPQREEEAYVLFVHPRDPAKETWTGKIQGTEGAVEAHGAASAYPLADLEARLPGFLENVSKVYFPLGRYPQADTVFLKALDTVRARARMGVEPPAAIADIGPLLHELRLRKSPAELERMREAVRITREAHIGAMRAARPGMMEYELEALLNFTFRRHGALGPAYGSIVAGGPNGCVLHYVTNDMPIEPGSLVLIDAGCEWRGYNADVTRTWPISGTFTDEQAAVYEIVLAANRAGIAAVKPGATLEDVHNAALRVLVEGLVEIGVLQGDVETIIGDGGYRPYFMHRTSHWLGRDVHDRGGYHKDGAPRTLEPGMVLTVEPGLYFNPATDAPERYKGIGIRIEDDVAVTETGHEVLTADIPKTRADVCALIGADAAGA